MPRVLDPAPREALLLDRENFLLLILGPCREYDAFLELPETLDAEGLLGSPDLEEKSRASL